MVPCRGPNAASSRQRTRLRLTEQITLPEIEMMGAEQAHLVFAFHLLDDEVDAGVVGAA